LEERRSLDEAMTYVVELLLKLNYYAFSYFKEGFSDKEAGDKPKSFILR
jgi:hypothetical protein